MQKQQQAPTAAPVDLRVVGVCELENGHGGYLVPSESDPTRYYVVEQWPSRLECQCKDAFFRRRQCKHIKAVVAHKQRLQLAEAEREYQLARVQLTETRQELQAINMANTGASASRGTQDMPGKPDRQGARPAYFGGRNQQAFSILK